MSLLTTPKQAAFVVVALGVLVNVGSHRSASAQEVEAEVLAADAWGALDRGAHKIAATLFELAYERQPKSSFIYGLALAHDRLDDVRGAYESYRSYLEASDTELDKQRLALFRVEELAPLYELLTRPPAPDVSEYSKPPPQLQWPKCPCPELQEILFPTTGALKPPPVPQEGSRRWLQPLTIPAMALGAAGAGTIAAGFGLARLARSEQLAFARSVDEDFKRRARARGQSLLVGSITLYATGSVLALASATWLHVLLRPLRRAARRNISLVSWLSPQTLGGEISWTF